MPTTSIGEPYGTPHMIERQMLFWNARLKADREGGREIPALRYRFVTISREVGSLGGSIAQELAGHLGWRVFDREIVDHIAEDAHVRHALVEQLDERAQNLVHETVRRILRLAEGQSFGEEEYHVSLMKALAYVAARGDAIVMGRGANFALHGCEGLHVRVTASQELRVDRLAARWNISRDAARGRLDMIDGERRAFIRHHYHRESADPNAFDLSLSTDRLSPAQGAASIVTALISARGAEAGGTAPKGTTT
jgi:cytidylate kinase